MTDETIQLNLPSRIDSIARAAEAAAEAARRAGLNDDAAFGLDMAVREAVTNAVLHGNRQDESKLVELTFEETAGALSVSIRDQGTGFDLDSIPDPTDEQNLLKASGRGILFMRNFMDTVEWEPHPAGGTVVRMTKSK